MACLSTGVHQEHPQYPRLQPVDRHKGVMWQTTEETLVHVNPELLKSTKVGATDALKQVFHNSTDLQAVQFFNRNYMGTYMYISSYCMKFLLAYSEIFVFVILFLRLKLFEGVGKASVDQILPDGVVQSSNSSSHLDLCLQS